MDQREYWQTEIKVGKGNFFDYKEDYEQLENSPATKVKDYKIFKLIGKKKQRQLYEWVITYRVKKGYIR